MLRNSRILTGLAAAVSLAVVQQALAFSFWGPAEAWQTAALNYGNRLWYGADLELGGTKNIGEAYRLNVPTLTYAFDQTFIAYFGQDGVNAVNAAMSALNGLPPASSGNLNSFNTVGNQQVNYTASALVMLDIKSAVMGYMIEHMGLIGETHIFDLRYRLGPAPGTQCEFSYLVIPRNWDPITFEPTPYVNGELYTYKIVDDCPNSQVGDAYEQPADGAAAAFEATAVATKELNIGLNIGGYYLGITRDDFAGLRYLYMKNRFAYENLDPLALPESAGTGGSPFSTPPGLLATNTTGVGVTTTTTNNGPYLLGGIEKVTFVNVQREWNQATGALNVTLQTQYQIPYVTSNGAMSQLSVTRTIVEPDILFTAADLLGTVGAAGYAITEIPSIVRGNFTTPLFIPGAVSAGGGVTEGAIGPGLIITLNEIGPGTYNINPGFLPPDGGIPIWQWGSFDGSTNPPIAYPNLSSLSGLEQSAASGANSGNAFAPAPTTATNTVTNAPVILQY